MDTHSSEADGAGPLADRRGVATDDTAVVFVALEGAERHDRTSWDDMLAAAVRRMRGELRRGDTVGRYGDGILALLSGVRGELGERVAQRMLASLDAEARIRVDQVAPGERLDDAATRASSA